RFGGGIKRRRMDDGVPRLDQSEQHGRYRRHARRESQRVFGTLPDTEPILQYLLIGAVEARIDQTLGAARAFARHPFEEAFAVGRAFENIGRGEEDRWFQRAFGERRIEAVPHHQGRGTEAAAAYFQRMLARTTAGFAGREVGFGGCRSLGQGIGPLRTCCAAPASLRGALSCSPSPKFGWE